MIRWLLALLFRPAGCTCDVRFYPTACDVDCPRHGLAALASRRIA